MDLQKAVDYRKILKSDIDERIKKKFKEVVINEFLDEYISLAK